MTAPLLLVRCFVDSRVVLYKEVGTFIHLPLKVHFNKSSIANILSRTHVMNILGAEVSIDNQATPGLILTYKNKSIKFTNDGGGLFHCDVKDFTLPIHTNVSTTKDSSQEAMTQVHAVSCLSTVEANKSKFSKKDQLKAKKARDLQHDLLWPSQAALIHYVESGQIQNCNITKLDILRAEAIYDPPLPHLQGKLTRQSLVKNHQTIVEGRESLNFKKTRLPFGAYAIVHIVEQTTP